MASQTRSQNVVLLWALVGACLLQPVGMAADPAAVKDREQRMQWWRDARFGMFVHWGLYSGLAGTWDEKPVKAKVNMEWIQQWVKADTDTYAERAIPHFKPKPGFAESWAKLAKQAGCEYLVFTTKHHDGFALHDSAMTDFDAGSVLQRDLVREIVDACRAEGLRVGFYHSVIDWHHDQYAYANSEQLPHPLRGKPYPNGERDHKKYVKFLHDQVGELTENYGPVDIIWWDYSSVDFQGDEAWEAFALMDKVRSRHPDVIMNNRLFRIVEAGWKGQGMANFVLQLDPKYGDFVTPEQHVPDEGMPGVDWETCMTMNKTWGFSEHDDAWKSPEVLIQRLVEIVSKGGNFLLNVGPKGDGSIPQESVERLEAIGEWMSRNGDAIHKATLSSVPSPSWGRVTQQNDGSAIYVCVFEKPNDGLLELNGMPEGCSKGTLLGSSETVHFEREGAVGRLHIPPAANDMLLPVIRFPQRAKGR